MFQDLDRILDYHQRTKHRPDAHARGPGRLDWSNQPDPFRKYQGAPVISLEKKGFEESKGCNGVFMYWCAMKARKIS